MVLGMGLGWGMRCGACSEALVWGKRGGRRMVLGVSLEVLRSPWALVLCLPVLPSRWHIPGWLLTSGFLFPILGMQCWSRRRRRWWGLGASPRAPHPSPLWLLSPPGSPSPLALASAWPAWDIPAPASLGWSLGHAWLGAACLGGAGAGGHGLLKAVGPHQGAVQEVGEGVQTDGNRDRGHAFRKPQVGGIWGAQGKRRQR